MSEPMNENPSQLIQSAFEQARRSGKPDWHRMTIAVLKNRLLILNSQFKETAFGVQTMRDFVKLADDIVRLDDTGPLPIVTLLGSESAEALHESQTPIRVRPDLWRAIMDYSHGSTFVWDADNNRARGALPTDSLPALPTLKEDDLRGWRKSFVEQHSTDIDPTILEKLQDWQNRILPSKVLPNRLAEAWLIELRDKVIERLRSWFATNGIDEPSDLLHASATSNTHTKKENDIEALRRLVIDCINVMDQYELSELRFSPSVLLRATREQKKRAD